MPSAVVRTLAVNARARKPCACATARCTLAGMPSLRAIASVFARYANTTFGGGSATIAVLREQIVEKRPWLDREQFDLAYALSRLTPGTNLLAFCTAAGWITRRGLGALFALLAASLPCSLLAVAIDRRLRRARDERGCPNASTPCGSSPRQLSSVSPPRCSACGDLALCALAHGLLCRDGCASHR